MSILMLKATSDTLLADAAQCDSRSLYFDRFADPLAKEDARNAWFKRAIGLKPLPIKLGAWKTWLGSAGHGLKSETILLAKLQSRLMVNMAGGVMVNAGLCLDRFGVLFIPGSAVKGCARRMAIQYLLEIREAQATHDRQAQLLADIALVFGWGEQDWSDKKKDGKFVSDFAFAVGSDDWKRVSTLARGLLPKANHFGGAVSFLAAFPYELPDQDLELDIVTGHHQNYYEEKMAVALDTEDPNPVVFPAAATNITFQFAVLPLRGGRNSLSQPGTKVHGLALEWLRQGIETFGLGAKTAAGYGWFEATEAVKREIIEKEALEAARLRQQQEEEKERLRRKQQEEERAKLKLALTGLPPEQQEDYKVAQLTPEQFRAKLDNFMTNKIEAEKHAVVRALRLDLAAAGSRRNFWEELKAKALKKGGRYAQVEQSIRQISKQLSLGKMP